MHHHSIVFWHEISPFLGRGENQTVQNYDKTGMRKRPYHMTVLLTGQRMGCERERRAVGVGYLR